MNADVVDVGWGEVAIAVLGLAAIIYIVVCFYKSLFLLFGMEMPDGKKPLAKFRSLVGLNLIVSLCSLGAIGRVETCLIWASDLTEILIGIVMYVYFRGKGRLFNNCIAAYAVLILLGLPMFIAGGAEDMEARSNLIFDWSYTLLIMASFVFLVVFVFCAKKLYLTVAGTKCSSLPAGEKES